MKNELVAPLLLRLAPAVAVAGIVDLAKSSGVQGGIVVHVGCGDGRETADLLLDDRYLVHGLDTSEANIAQARRNIQSLHRYGRVSVAKFDGRHLPYADNLVNLLIDSTGGSVADQEILRVLVPGGVAFVGERKFVKPRPADIDDWSHLLHGADNNAVARDRKVGIPRSIQWVAEPRWCRTHEEMASLSAAVTSWGAHLLHRR